MTQTAPSSRLDDDEIDLRQLVAVLWRQKSLIVVAGLLGGALGLGASILNTKYVTENLLLTPGISANTYKRYQAMLTSSPRLARFLETTGQLATPEGQLLAASTREQGRLAELVRPEFAFTDRDSKTFGVKISPEDPGAMIGIHLSFEHASPTDGKPITLLADYVRNTLIRVDMQDITLDNCTKLAARDQELRNAQIENQFSIREESSRLERLVEIVARHPESNTIDNRQIVSVEKGNERFLSAAAQLFAAEVQIADMKLADARFERDRTANGLKREYYCQAQQALQSASTGDDFLEDLLNIQTRVFQTQDRNIDVIEQAWNELDLERTGWLATYQQSTRLAVPAEGTETKVSKPRKAIGLALGGLLGGMLGMFLALIRAWWKNEDAPAAR